MSESSEHLPDPLQTPGFDESKRQYFSQLALKVLPALRLHREQGLFIRTDEGRRDWGNVSEHCLVEAARASVLADMLHLPDDLKEDLMLAAALHDFYKKAEVTMLKSGGTSWESYAQAQVEAKMILEAKQFAPRIIELATSMGHEQIPRARELLSKEVLSNDEVAWLAMHYIDDYTIDENWVRPATLETDGSQVNDLDRRIARLLENAEPGKKYHNVNLSGLEHFGDLTYNAQLETGRIVEDRIAQILSKISNAQVDPKRLPEIIDAQLAKLIAA